MSNACETLMIVLIFNSGNISGPVLIYNECTQRFWENRCNDRQGILNFYLCSTHTNLCLSKSLSDAFPWSVSKGNIRKRVYRCIIVPFTQPPLRYKLFRCFKIFTVQASNAWAKHKVCLQQKYFILVIS